MTRRPPSQQHRVGPVASLIPPTCPPNCTFLILNLAFLQPQHRIPLFFPLLLPPLRRHAPVDVLTRRRTGHSTAISSLP